MSGSFRRDATNPSGRYPPPSSPSRPGQPSTNPSGSFSPRATSTNPVAGAWSGDAPQPEFQGAEVGRYELLFELAAGGMGSVYIGRQRGAAGFERLVAIKRMHPHLTHDQSLTMAFHEEARIASLIHHANVVTVVDVYEEGGEHLLVMEYIDGVSVASLVGSARKLAERLPRPVAVRIAVDALHGLHAAHEIVGMDGRAIHVVHRDVSPQNILLGADGSVHLTDFGIARALERLVRTETGNLKGKLRYMSPEQAVGEPVDRRTDLYALGIVLWEMIAGRKLRTGENDFELLQAAGAGNPTPLAVADPSVPPALDAIVMRALARNPTDRFASAATFAEVLETWARQAGELASPVEVAETVARFAGTRIAERRLQLQEILAGSRPSTIRNSTSHPVVSTPTPTAGSAVLHAPRESLQPRPRAAWPLLVGLVAIALSLIVGVLIMLQTSSKQAGNASGTPQASSALPTVEQVEVTVRADVPIVEIRGPGVTDVRFDPQGATFHVPRAKDVVEVEVTFSDAVTLHEKLTPSANVALRLRAEASSSARPSGEASSAPISSAAPSVRATSSAKPPSTGVGGVGGLKKSPYDP